MYNLDARITIDGEVSTIRDFAIRGKITPAHFFADVESRGGWPAGPEITREAFEELRELRRARGHQMPCATTAA
jgi:hypothetical protein